MNTVQFDPKITPDFQLDWRRPSSRDPFADLLKRHFEIDQRARAPKTREEAADPLSGRPPRVVIAHERTLRGEAKRVEDAERSLADHTAQARCETCAKEEETPAPEDGAAADANTSEQDAAVEAPANAEGKAVAEQPTPDVEGEAGSVEPVVPVVVAVQPAAEVDGEVAILVVPLLAPTEGEIQRGQADQANQVGASPNGGETDDKAIAEQQAVGAMAEAGLMDSAAALMTGDAAPAAAATPVPAASAQLAPPATPTRPEQPLLQTQVLAPFVEPVAIAPAQTERSSANLGLRANAPARPAPATPASPAPATTPAQAAQPNAGTLLQPVAGSEFASTGEPFYESLSEGDPGQGWALHLAQGAASKRPDFVAQLRQHLQNLPAHEQVAVHLQRAVREGTNRFSIQLSPAELGNIHVKLEIDEDKRVTAAVTVERPSTLELLQRDTKGLERALHNAGLNMEGGDLSFSLGHGDREFAQDLRHSTAAAAGGSVLDAESDGEQPESPVAQVTDTAAGVVNLQV